MELSAAAVLRHSLQMLLLQQILMLSHPVRTGIECSSSASTWLADSVASPRHAAAALRMPAAFGMV